MTDADITLLAKAMGVDPNLFGPLWGNPIFDPRKDANHDYAVLQWMLVDEQYERFAHVINGTLRVASQRDYKIGDYARAALKGINND